jgi:hypothetical protein
MISKNLERRTPLKNLDFKKAEKEFYLPKTTAKIVTIPKMQYAAIAEKDTSGYGDAFAKLYALAYALKTADKCGHVIPDFTDYVIPPVESLYKEEEEGRTYMMRLPDFVRREDFRWCQQHVLLSKGIDLSAMHMFEYDEGLCVQCMHHGALDDEEEVRERMEEFLEDKGYAPDTRRQCHTIFISNPKRVEPNKRRTVLRQPIWKVPANPVLSQTA